MIWTFFLFHLWHCFNLRTFFCEIEYCWWFYNKTTVFKVDSKFKVCKISSTLWACTVSTHTHTTHISRTILFKEWKHRKNENENTEQIKKPKAPSIVSPKSTNYPTTILQTVSKAFFVWGKRGGPLFNCLDFILFFCIFENVFVAFWEIYKMDWKK